MTKLEVESGRFQLKRKQARKPRSYASPKLRLTDSLTYLLTGVKCRATSVAKNDEFGIIVICGIIIFMLFETSISRT